MNIIETVKNGISYLCRPTQFDPFTSRKSNTIVVFLHGIFSSTKRAYRISKERFFWDLLKDHVSLSSVDFAGFNYGITDPRAFIGNRDFIKDLDNLSFELREYIEYYEYVILIGHSHGGLLAKTYASLYHGLHGVYLITLQTPHDPTQITRAHEAGVMMDSILTVSWHEDEEGKKNICYLVPHIFAGSVHDYKMGSIEGQLHGCRDFAYRANDPEKRRFGHSHLSSCPDSVLLNKIRKEIVYFRNSGHGRKSRSCFTFGGCVPEGKQVLRLIASSSNYLLNKFIEERNQMCAWKSPFFNDLMESADHIARSLSSGVNFVLLGFSTDYFERHIINLSFSNYALEVDTIATPTENIPEAANTHLCERLFTTDFSGSTNPYRKLPFDVRDIPKGIFINNSDFLGLFASILESKKCLLSDVYRNARRGGLSTMNYEHYRNDLIMHYRKAMEQYRENLLCEMFETCMGKGSKDSLSLDERTFVEKMSAIIQHYTTDNFRNGTEYIDIHAEMKIKFYDPTDKKNISTREIECCISKLFKCSFHRYYLGRDIRILFSQNATGERRWGGLPPCHRDVTSYYTKPTILRKSIYRE